MSGFLRYRIYSCIAQHRWLFGVCLLIGMATMGAVAAGGMLPRRLPSLNASHLAHVVNDQKFQQVVVVLRHAERCDRSDHQCLASHQGITVRGAQRAASLGQAWRLVIQRPYQIFTSDTLRTQQSAAAFNGTAAVAVDANLDPEACRHHFFDRFQPAITRPGASLKVLFSHSECLSFITQHYARRPLLPGYLDGLVLGVGPHRIKVIGVITPQQLVKATHWAQPVADQDTDMAVVTKPLAAVR